MLTDLTILIDRAAMAPRRITKAPAKGVMHGAIVANPLALIPDVEGEGEALKYMSHDLPIILSSWLRRRLEGEEDHLARMIISISTTVMYRPSKNVNDLDTRIDVINTSINAPVTVDALIRQAEPPIH